MEIDWKKKYNEALEKIKRYAIDEYGCTRLKPTDIFPELSESEDERIRKHLIEVAELYWGTTNDPDKAKDIDWLERHKGPQTPGIEIGKSYKCIASPRFTCFRKGEVYVVEDEWMAKLFSVSEGCFEAVEHPKEQDKCPEYCVRSHCIGCPIYEKEEEQKPEWSEEDEKMLTSFLHKVEVCDLLTNKENVWIVKRLKSLRPRWKPSEEQMRAFHELLGGKVPRAPELYELYDDLEKLI